MASKAVAPAPGSYSDPRTALESTKRYVCVYVCLLYWASLHVHIRSVRTCEVQETEFYMYIMR